MEKSHLVVVGCDEIVINKYLPCVEESVQSGKIDSYSILDLESERDVINTRVQSARLKPENIFFIRNPQMQGTWSDSADFEPIFAKLRESKKRIKVYIATELKAHEGYLRYCIEKGIDSLVEKPVMAPMRNGIFYPEAIESDMRDLIRKNQILRANHSVMTLSRYHKIYNDEVIEPLKQMMIRHQAPLTSFHFRTAGGVWNLHREYETREDHPYKYGYGMLMHGAYHYIDLSSQFLLLNKLIFPKDTFTLILSSYVAHPFDQNDRIPKQYSARFDDDMPDWPSGQMNQSHYGETDVTSTFCLKNDRSGKVLTTGTLSFEQTTPSIRSWKRIPPNIYNKNGRTSNVDLEAQLSTIHSVNVQCFDVPVRVDGNIERMDAFARISTRTNASLLTGEQDNTERTFDGLFHSDSNRKLMTMWLNDEEHKSTLESHFHAMRLTQALAESILKPGYPVELRFF